MSQLDEGLVSAALDTPLRRAALQDMLRRQAARNPNRTAVVDFPPTGGRRAVTYAELDARVNRIAHRWLAAGIGRGDVVAAVGPACVEFVAAYYAALRVGAMFTSFNPDATVTELAYLLGHATPALLVVGGNAGHTVADAVALASADPRRESMDDLFAATDGEPGIEPPSSTRETDTALLVYTSGTESRPKGVLLTHRSFLIATTFSWVLEGYLRPSDRFLLLAPLHTMAGVGTVTNIVSIGATAVLAPGTDAGTALQIIEAEQVTNVSQTPTFYRRLADAPGFTRDRLRSVEQCHNYGGMVQADVFEAIHARAPWIQWATYWGQSELAQLGSVGWFRELADIPGGDVRWIGKPVPHLDIRVVDEDDNDCEVGELVVRSPSVMSGYRDDPVATEAALRGGWLRTGDIVALGTDGNLFFHDRRKDMIKTGGMSVSTLEVEHVLAGHPWVAEAAVVGVPDQDWLEAVTAFVVLKDGAQVTPDELRRHCRAVLSGYKVPKAIHFIPDMPRDAQGKVRKRALRDGDVSDGH